MSTPVNDEWLTSARRILANISAEQPCRAPRVTCSVCAKPVDGYARCYHCNAHHNSEYAGQLADLVVPLAYAGACAVSGQRGFEPWRSGPGATSPVATSQPGTRLR